MCLVNEQIELVLFLETNQIWQICNGPLHREQAFANNQNLLPSFMCLWLPLTYFFSQQLLQIIHIVMFVAFDDCPAKPRSDPDAGMIQFIRNDQTGPIKAGKDVAFVLKPIENTIASSFPTKFAISRSTSNVRSEVPASSRGEAEERPHVEMVSWTSSAHGPEDCAKPR
jgi:hypothetical protein